MAWPATSTIPRRRCRVWKRLQADDWRAHRGSAPDRQEARTRADLRIGALGSGSDYTAFLDHLGIASLNLGFGGEDQGGIYHSIYDDFYWYTHFADTDFVYGRALAQTAGTVGDAPGRRRAAAATISTTSPTPCAATSTKCRNWRSDKRDQIIERNRQIDEGVFAMIDDPRNPRIRTRPAETVPPFLNFAPLENGLAALQRTAKAYDKALAHASENGGRRWRARRCARPTPG